MRYSPMLAAAALAFAVAAQAPARADDQQSAAASDKVVATVGDMQVRQSDLKMAENGLGPQLDKLPPKQRRVAALSTAIDVKMLAEKAKAAGLDKTEAFKQQMAFMRERELHNLYFKQNVVDSITDAEVKARYEKEIAAQPAKQEVKARHILVKTKKEAEAIIKKLDNGADFAKLAKDKSTGPSAQKGGELGFFTKGQMVPAFDKAAFALKKGKYTEQPVKTQFGWHVIQVEDKRQAPPPPLAQVSDQIKQVLMRQRYFDVLKKARDEMNVDVKDPDLKKAYDAANAAQAGAAKGGAGATAGDSAN